MIEYKATKRACYFTYLAMSTVYSLPPLLFAGFRQLYGISYTLLGTLVLINFCTQLGIDFAFSFFSRCFNVKKVFRVMPLLSTLGLCVYALMPMLFPQYAYVGLVIGTIIFSIAAALSEVLISPMVAHIAGDNAEKDISVLHSLYGYGFVGVVLISTVFLQLAGIQNWIFLTLAWAVLPVIAFLRLQGIDVPDLNMAQQQAGAVKSKHRTKSIVLCMICIFLGSGAENTMSNWVSVYAENVLHISKLWGDVLGMSLFAIVLALTRSVYAKYGKNISKTLMYSMLSSIVLYIVVAASSNGIVSLIACVAMGVSTSMLWPGTLILLEEKVHAPGMAAYALMAVGGDLGASFAPQSLGIIVDKIAATQWASAVGSKFNIAADAVGFKIGMLFIALFPLLGVILLLYMKRHFKKGE